MIVLTDKIRYQLCKQLAQNPNLTQRELAATLGISLGKTNYCLNALINKGWVKVRNFGYSQSKLGYAYLLTKKGMEEKSRVMVQFFKRKQQEYDDLVKELDVLRKEAAQFELTTYRGRINQE